MDTGADTLVVYIYICVCETVLTPELDVNVHRGRTARSCSAGLFLHGPLSHVWCVEASYTCLPRAFSSR